MASNVEDILKATIDGKIYGGNVESRVEELLVELKDKIDEGGGGGTGNYNELVNKPIINNVELEGIKSLNDLGIPTSLSALSDDSTHRTVTDAEKTAWNSKSNFSGSYDDLTNKPTIPTSISALSDDSTHRTVTDAEKTSWNGKSNFSGSYGDLTSKPTINNVELTGNKTTEDLIPIDSETLDFDENGYLTVIGGGGGGGGDYETLRQYIYNAYRRERKDITAKVQNGDFDKAVHEQDLAKYGIAIGDYFQNSSNGYVYYVADMNTFKQGPEVDTTSVTISANHVALIVDTKVTAQYNSTSTWPSSNGFLGTSIYTFLTGTVLSNIQTDIVNLAPGYWNQHLVSHSMYVPDNGHTVKLASNEFITLLSLAQVFGICDYISGEGEATKKLEIFNKFDVNEFFGTVINRVWLRTLESNSTPWCFSTILESKNCTNSHRVVGLIIYKAQGD